MPTPLRIPFMLILLASAVAGCGEAPKPPAAQAPPDVTVARPVTKTIVDQDEYVGRFVAVDTVEVRARVSGHLEKVHFVDGQLVKEGDLLFTIDRLGSVSTIQLAEHEMLERLRLVFRRHALEAARADGGEERSAIDVHDPLR